MDTELYFSLETLLKNDDEITNPHIEPMAISRIANQQRALILTANQRQTRYLSTVFDNTGAPFHRSPISTYPHWLSNTWSELQDLAHPLSKKQLSSPAQEQFIWEQVIDNISDTPPLIDTSSLYKHIQDAYRIILSYDIPEHLMLETDDDETQFLMRCIADYKHRLNLLNFISTEQLPGVIQQALSNSSQSLFDTIYLYGFADIPPEMYALLKGLSDKCFKVRLQEPANSPNRPTNADCYHFDDIDSELSAASLWANKKTQESPNAKIAIVAPNLTSIKPQLESALLKAFDPDYFLSNERFETNKHFDISAAEPLINTPVVDAIFTLMKLRKPLLDKEDCRKVCTSIFWGQPDLNVSAQLLNWINNHSSPKISPDLLSKQWSYFDSKFECLSDDKNDTHDAALTETPQQNDLFSSQYSSNKEDEDAVDDKNNPKRQSHRLSNFRENLRLVSAKPQQISARFASNPAFKSFNSWVDWLLSSLKNIGWPGPRVPNTYEYQQLQSFFNAIDVLRSLDQCHIDPAFITDKFDKSEFRKDKKQASPQPLIKIPLSSFLHQLTTVCTNMVFHMQTKDTKVSVLGLMEASALPFDFCWVIGMSDDELPSAPNPNPFIPLPLQREYQTPRSTPNREFEYANAFVQDLESYCHHLIFSYTQNETSAHVKKSPLLEHIIDSPVPETLLSPDIINQYYESATKYVDFQVVLSGTAPEIREGDNLPGGSSHISLYAVNPMFAFFRYRLFARSQLPQSIGYTAIERGQLVHDILETVFQKHTSKVSLQSWLDEKSVTIDLDNIIQACLLHIQKRAKKSVSPALFLAEKHYQKKQILQFLSLELERDDFDVIETESTKILDICKRKINLRIDRIDQVQNEYSIIFDYKTGTVNLSELQSEPLFDCQLPLYSLIDLKKPIGAVAYAKISKKGLGYAGIGQCEPVKTTGQKTQVMASPVVNNTVNNIGYHVELQGICDPKTLNKKSLPNTWSETLHWWEEQLHYSVSRISSGHCTYINRNNSKSAFHSDLLYAVRPEEFESSHILNTDYSPKDNNALK